MTCLALSSMKKKKKNNRENNVKCHLQLFKFSWFNQQMTFEIFLPEKTGFFDISCKLSPTICIKCQSLFSGEN